MKISKLLIDDFAEEELQRIQKQDVAGNDLVLEGGNRSGKTLSFNAFLYGLFGPRATFNVSPGRTSTVRFHFDNEDVLERGGSVRKYTIGGEGFLKDNADEKIEERVGSQEIVQRHFIHSETGELPLSKLSDDKLINGIRKVVESEIQSEIEDLREQEEDSEQEIEEIERLELQPRKEELSDIDVGQFEQRLEKVEALQSLIDSGQIHNIKNQLQENAEIRNRVEDLNDRLRTVRQELRKKERQLREEQRFTDEVDDLIIDAIQELICPVCDAVVPQELAENRLSRGHCPQCGRDHSIDEVRQRLQERVDDADDNIEHLESEISELREERDQIEAEISDLEESSPDLSGLNDLTIHTLKKNNYDIAKVESETQDSLRGLRETIADQEQRMEQLNDEITEIRNQLEEKNEELEEIDAKIRDLLRTSYEEDIESFRESWSETYEELAPNLAAEIYIERDGKITVPGTFRMREYDELSTGEVRLLNVAFAITIAQESIGVDGNGHNFECIILDEPFTNIDEEIRDEAIEYIQDSDLQFILTTSDDDVADQFEDRQVKSLERISIQATFEDVREMAADD